MNGRVRDIYALFAAIVLLIAAFIGPEVEASVGKYSSNFTAGNHLP
jgi:hypothetical protein